jgi:hypothetical protein
MALVDSVLLRRYQARSVTATSNDPPRVHLPVAPEAAGPDAFEELPLLHRRWLGELLGGAGIPREALATCDRCVMALPEDERPPEAETWFSPDLKCCTHLPVLPNFVVGAILRDPAASEEGRAGVRARLRPPLATPLGLGQSAPFARVAEREFGRNPALRCPHLQPGTHGCSIHRHRVSTCATWFCKHVRGAAGSRFWGAVRQLLGSVEASLSCACLLDLGFAPAQLAALYPPWVVGSEPPEDVDVTRAWGAWLGREEDLYAACSERVEGLAFGDVVARCGAQTEALARVVAGAFADLERGALPERAVVRSFEALPTGADTFAIHTYSPHDAIALPAALVRELYRFDGRPLAETLEALRRERGLTLSTALLRTLVDFDVLAEPEG